MNTTTNRILARLESDRQNADPPLTPPPEYEPITYRNGGYYLANGDEINPRLLSAGGPAEGERGLWYRRGNLAYFRGR